MAKLLVLTLDEDVIESLHRIYRERGFPLGKSRRGRKKWLKRFIVAVLTIRAKEILGETENYEHDK